MLRLEGLSRTHEGARAAAVSNVDLHVEKGEILVVVGPSGCGKSSILRLIAGLDEPSAGSIALDGKSLTGVPPEKRDVAMVFQGYALYPHLTARANLEFPLRMRGLPKAERAKKVDDAAKLLDIAHLLERRPDQLSGGERQRVAMGRALVRAPKVFLFDEPLSNLDAALRTTLRTELASLLRRLGATAIYVTHDQVEAMTVGHRVAVMRAGSVEQVGTPREVYASPKTFFVASFLGAPKINALPIRRANERVTVLGAPVEAPPHAARACLRPEHLGIAAEPAAGAAEPEAETEHAPATVSWKGTLTVVEPLGAETILHCDVAGETLRLTETGFSPRAVGDAVTLRAAPSALLFFDEAGRRTGVEAPA